MSRWVNFQELRQRLDFAAVLRHYSVEAKVKGSQATAYCPLPSHPQHEGKRRSRSFSVNLDKGIWQCFGCGGKGNVIEFAARMEKLNPDDPREFRQAALLLQERFCPNESTPDRASSKRGKERVSPGTRDPSTSVSAHAERKDDTRCEDAIQPDPKRHSDVARKPVKVNTPLDFQLTSLATDHPYFAKRKLTAETLAHFGLGYCGRGLMAGRIAIPLHDQAGSLIGYAGRLVDDAKIDCDNPKYRFPGDRERDGVVHEFRKSMFVYNGQAICGPVDDLIVVEGFPSVWWLWQAGRQNVVALMGASCSAEQASIIVGLVALAGRIWIMPDGDDAGARCAGELLTLLAPHRFVRWVKLDKGKQPTDFQPAELDLLFPPA